MFISKACWCCMVKDWNSNSFSIAISRFLVAEPGKSGGKAEKNHEIEDLRTLKGSWMLFHDISMCNLLQKPPEKRLFTSNRIQRPFFKCFFFPSIRVTLEIYAIKAGSEQAFCVIFCTLFSLFFLHNFLFLFLFNLFSLNSFLVQLKLLRCFSWCGNFFIIFKPFYPFNIEKKCEKSFRRRRVDVSEL